VTGSIDRKQAWMYINTGPILRLSNDFDFANKMNGLELGVPMDDIKVSLFIYRTTFF
jgi:hypothetical protein